MIPNSNAVKNSHGCSLTQEGDHLAASKIFFKFSLDITSGKKLLGDHLSRKILSANPSLRTEKLISFTATPLTYGQFLSLDARHCFASALAILI